MNNWISLPRNAGRQWLTVYLHCIDHILYLLSLECCDSGGWFEPLVFILKKPPTLLLTLFTNGLDPTSINKVLFSCKKVGVYSVDMLLMNKWWYSVTFLSSSLLQSTLALILLQLLHLSIQYLLLQLISSNLTLERLLACCEVSWLIELPSYCLQSCSVLFVVNPLTCVVAPVLPA